MARAADVVLDLPLAEDGGESGVPRVPQLRLLSSPRARPTLMASLSQALSDTRTNKTSATGPSSACSFTHVVTSAEEHEEMHTEEFPESIYGAGMSFFVQSGLTRNHRVHCLSLLVVLIMVCGIALQAVTVSSVKAHITEPAVRRSRALYDEYHRVAFVDGAFSQGAFDAWDAQRKERLCQLPLSQPKFSFIILLIWTMSLVSELKETLLFVLWWLQLPACEDEDVRMVKPVDGESELGLVLVSASTRVKALVVGAILIPKLSIALALWLLGANWLLATPDCEGLVLNAMALAFILELDELIYTAVLPQNAKKTLARFKLSTKEGLPSGDTNALLLKWMGHMVAISALTAAIPVLYMRFFQDILPGYRFDVHEPCRAYLLSKGL